MTSPAPKQQSSLVFMRGDPFATKVDVRINTVNCLGVMGTGIALEFKKRYPEMYVDYRDICIAGKLAPGILHVWRHEDAWIVNFPTKRRWSEPSRYEDVELGLIALRDYLAELGPVKVALPALGCSNGGLEWSRVSGMIRETLEGLEATIYVFEPAAAPAAKGALNFISSFRGAHFFLSNFYLHSIDYEDMRYPSTEHAFQAAKSLDVETRRAIAMLKTPDEAKKAGRAIERRADWESVKLDVMREVLRIKFADAALCKKLLATGNVELIEGNTWNDTYWGVCNGRGENWLGKLLMELRKSLQKPGAKAQLPLVAPLSVQARQAKRGPSVPLYDARAHGADCDNCPLNGLPVVPPSLPTACEVPDAILIGQEPGMEEERQFRAFIGPSGKKVNKMLDKHGLVRERMHVTNAALCRPRQDEDRLAAVKCCAPRLRKEIDAIPKNVPAVPMGVYAFMSTYGRKIPITLARGFQFEKDGREIYPTLHPAFVLRDHIQSPLFSRDFRRVAKRIHQGYLELDTPKSFSVPRTAAELKNLLAKFGPRVACDIETTEDMPTRCELLCIGISDVKTTIVIPWFPFFKHLLNQFFKTHRVVGHNFFAFDSIVLERYGITAPMTDNCVPVLEDTLIAHHIFASHMPQRLDHLASFYLDTIPWKIKFGKRASDEKGKPKVPQNEEELFKYNALDAHITARVDQEMQADLDDGRHGGPWRALYTHDKELAALCRDMQQNGVLVDKKLKDELSVAILEKEKRLYEEMKAINDGEDFAPTKTAHIRRILFDKFKAPVLERTMKGLPSTNKKVLQAFAAAKDRPYGEFCKKLVTLRACSKMRVTYLDNLPIEADGRVRAGWRSFGTPTGRFACIAKGTPIEVVRDVSTHPKGIAIEDVKVGDYAYSYTDDGALVLRKVLNVTRTGVRKVVRVHWLGTGKKHRGYLDLTPDHEVKLTNGQWIPAGELKRSDRIVSLSRAIDYYGYARLFPTGLPMIPREHRFIYAQVYGKLPEHVHHLNENRLDNRYWNLEGIDAEAHAAHHGRFVHDATRQKRRDNARSSYADGLGANVRRGADHPMWLGLKRGPTEQLLRQHRWSVTMAARAGGYDFDSFKRNLLHLGFDLHKLKCRNQVLRGHRDLSFVKLNDRSFVESVLQAHNWSITKASRACGGDYDRFKKHLVKLGLDISAIKKKRIELRRTATTNHSVLSVERLERSVDVYDLEIEGTHNFIAGELCVHNCRKPNLTNLRRPENKEPEQRIREIYIAKPGHTLVGFDMSQVEPRCAAYVSGDVNMMAVFDDPKGDFHTANARVLFGDLPELVDPKEAKHGKGKNMRTMAKSAGLAVNYLAGADKLFETIRAQGFSVRYPQVVAMLERLHRAYHGHFERVDQDVEFVRKHGFLKVGRLSGRIRWLGHAPSPSDCANGPIQGTAADVMNALLIRIWKRMKKTFGDTVKLIGQIHDAAIFEVPIELTKIVSDIIQEEADKPVMINGRPVIFPIDLKDGPRWVDV